MSFKVKGADGQPVLLEGQLRRGYSGDLAWYSPRTNLIFQVKIRPESSEHPDATIARIREDERRSWRAYLLGLPRLAAGSVRWQEGQFTALTVDMMPLEAHLELEANSDRVTGLRYRYSNGPANITEGQIRYHYDADSAVYPLPAVFEHEITRGSDVYAAARARVTVRLLRLTALAEAKPATAFLPPESTGSLAHISLRSNGMVFVRSREGKFLPVTPAMMQQGQRLKPPAGERHLVFAAMLATTVAAILVFALRRAKKQQTTKREEL